MLDRRLKTKGRVSEAGERPIVIEAKRARAGLLGVRVLYVLIAGTLLAVCAFLIVYFVFHHAVP